MPIYRITIQVIDADPLTDLEDPPASTVLVAADRIEDRADGCRYFLAMDGTEICRARLDRIHHTEDLSDTGPDPEPAQAA
jgi:hypothetical protein